MKTEVKEIETVGGLLRSAAEKLERAAELSKNTTLVFTINNSLACVKSSLLLVNSGFGEVKRSGPQAEELQHRHD